LKSNCERAKFR